MKDETVNGRQGWLYQVIRFKWFNKRKKREKKTKWNGKKSVKYSKYPSVIFTLLFLLSHFDSEIIYEEMKKKNEEEKSKE